MSDKIELNARQKKFADNYLKSGNASESATKAGYARNTAPSQGQRLLKNENVQAYMHARLEKLDKKHIADTQEVLEYLTAVLRGEHDDEVVMNIGKGKGVTAAEKVKAKVGAKERLKAAEMLAKVNGLFINRQEIDFAGTLPIVIHDDI